MIKPAVFVVFLVFRVVCSVHVFHNARTRGGRLGRPGSSYNGPLPEDQWFTQKLDHFDPTNERTWRQRYFTNSTFFRGGSDPVFLMIGGEGTADPIWMVDGQWIQYAKMYNALCFQLEHRYYGKSHPTNDTSVSNLRYLSSEQALADLANFRVTVSQQLNLTDSNKWIVFGGSYPGSLAAWFRLKYPHLTVGAVASSAPLYAQIDFKEYLGVVTDAMTTADHMCPKQVQTATRDLEKLIQSAEGRSKVKAMFSLCEDLDTTNSQDMSNFFSSLAGNIEGVVQYNKDNREFEGATGTNITVELLCSMMCDTKSSAVENYAKINALMLKTYNQSCLDFSYKTMIQGLQNTSWESESAEGGRQWTYQTCTEFGYYQSSDLDTQPFGHMFPVNFSVDQCRDIFGADYDLNLLQYAVKRTNTMYGGKNIKVTKVVFPNGSIDPWHALGITKDISPQATAIFIKGTAHCADMYPESPNDPPQLRIARKQIIQLLGQWLK